jgi:hypothetical protein
MDGSTLATSVTYKNLLSFLLLFVPQTFVHMLSSTLCLLAIERFLSHPLSLFKGLFVDIIYSLQ